MNSKRLALSFVYILAVFAFLAAWYFTKPATDSGWLLALAFIAGVFGLNNEHDEGFIHTPLLISCGFGVTWYFSRGAEDAGWALAGCFLAGYVLFDRLNKYLSTNEKSDTDD